MQQVNFAALFLSGSNSATKSGYIEREARRWPTISIDPPGSGSPPFVWDGVRLGWLAATIGPMNQDGGVGAGMPPRQNQMRDVVDHAAGVDPKFMVMRNNTRQKM